MIRANYICFGCNYHEEFDDDDLLLAAHYLMNGTIEGHFSMENITDSDGEVLMSSEDIIEST